MNKISFYGIMTTFVLSALLFSSCDQDFSEIGSGIVDDDHFTFLPDTLSSVSAFTLATGVLQSNNLPLNSLGIYNNPVFGKVKANFVTQLELGTLNPVFDTEKNPVLDSVVLTIPYFSTKKSGTDGTTTYTIDSLKGAGAIDLKVFESKFVLNSLDPVGTTQQRYYTDQDSDFNGSNKGVQLNTSTDVKENSQFNPSSEASAKSYVSFKVDRGLNIITPKEVEARLAPRIRLKLDKAFFQSKIMNAPAGKLINNNIFKEYFRGIYFQVADATDGTLMQLDFSKGDITMHYHEYAKIEEGQPVKYENSDKDSYGGTPKLTAKTLVLNMKGNTVSLLETQNSNMYANGILNPNKTEGDAKLYLKGGEGSIAVIDLFGADNFGKDGLTGSPDGTADELNIIRSKGKDWLVNEANLTFYIDRDAMGNAPDPQRLYLYDLNNNRPVIDWSMDQSGTSTKPKNAKSVHDGIIQREAGKGVKYRIRITNHIRNLIRKDSTNVRLGLAVTEAISLTANVRLKTPLPQSSTFTIDRSPAASLLNPLGTILYGNNIDPQSPGYAKRIKLEIYYTKPN